MLLPLPSGIEISVSVSLLQTGVANTIQFKRSGRTNRPSSTDLPQHPCPAVVETVWLSRHKRSVALRQLNGTMHETLKRGKANEHVHVELVYPGQARIECVLNMFSDSGSSMGVECFVPSSSAQQGPHPALRWRKGSLHEYLHVRCRAERATLIRSLRCRASSSSQHCKQSLSESPVSLGVLADTSSHSCKIR